MNSLFSHTDLHVQVKDAVRYEFNNYMYALLWCQGSCRLPDHLNYVWYQNQQKMKEGASYTSLFNSPDRVSCAVKGHEDFRSPSICEFNLQYFTNSTICWSI